MNTRLVQIAAACAALLVTAKSGAAELPLPKDGWASWQVEAVEGAPAWCCWSWNNKDAKPTVCQLDGDNQGYGDHGKETTDALRVYARFKAGKVERVRAYAASCRVEAKTPIQSLENVATDDSARWLVALSKSGALPDRRGNDHETLAPLAMHRGAVAFEALSAMSRDAGEEARKNAIFWLAMVRGTQGADIATRAMFDDASSEVRKHSAFAVAQSKSPSKGPDLIKLGNTDKDADVRAQAWFWLAHTDTPNAEESIRAAAKNDADDHVREQAIFALSQLPDERGTQALIEAAQDRTLSNEQRKRAVFWLAQSDKPSAQAFLEKTLAKSAPN